MSNDEKVLARLFKLWAMICKMIMDGKRDAKRVADKFQEIVDETAYEPRSQYYRLIKAWERFYLDHFNLAVDFSQVQIPDFTKVGGTGQWCLLLIAQGLTNDQVYAVLEKHFTCQNYVGDLSRGVPANERDPKNGAYAIWVRDTVEADECHRNKSANMVQEEGLKTETLLERMLHELKYFLETGKHLDIQNVTLCSGSRLSDGYVPSARWRGDKFRVYWNYVDNRSDDLRPREVISLV